MNTVKELVTKNRSYRGYNEARKVSREELLDMIDCGRLSASSRNVQPLMVLAIGEPAETIQLEVLEPGGASSYYRTADGVHHVPKRRLEDIVLS